MPPPPARLPRRAGRGAEGKSGTRQPAPAPLGGASARGGAPVVRRHHLALLPGPGVSLVNPAPGGSCAREEARGSDRPPARGPKPPGEASRADRALARGAPPPLRRSPAAGRAPRTPADPTPSAARVRLKGEGGRERGAGGSGRLPAPRARAFGPRPPTLAAVRAASPRSGPGGSRRRRPRRGPAAGFRPSDGNGGEKPSFHPPPPPTTPPRPDPDPAVGAGRGPRDGPGARRRRRGPWGTRARARGTRGGGEATGRTGPAAGGPAANRRRGGGEGEARHRAASPHAAPPGCAPRPSLSLSPTDRRAERLFFRFDGVESRAPRGAGSEKADGAAGRPASASAPVMILPQVHLRKPCYDFYFL